MVKRWQKWAGALLLFCLFLATGSRPAQAHPADMYTQTYRMQLAPDGVDLTWTVSPGPLLAASTWREADLDGDEVVRPPEAEAWARPLLRQWESYLNQTAPVAWQLTAVSWPADIVAFELGDAPIEVTLHADYPTELTEDRYRLDLHNPYAEEVSINWFDVRGVAGVAFHPPAQENGRIVIDFTLSHAETAAPLTIWDSGTPSLTAGAVSLAVFGSGVAPDNDVASAETTPSVPEDRRPYAVLTDLVRRQERSPLFLLTALGIALALGAMHGLTPGHGKALVAAYLVGSRGAPRHAAALGGVVTLTHTGSVLAIGLVTLAASRFLVPTDLFPWLEIASGLLIIIMGLGLLQQRWRGWRGVRRKRAAEKAAAVREASSERRRAAGGSEAKRAGRQRIAIGADIPIRVYDGVLPDEGKTAVSSSDVAADTSPGTVRWRSLLALGVSGGLVPCPDAIAILLVAVTINRLALGLSLIVSFSLGLAAILIGIGLAMVQSRRFFNRFNKLEQWAPAISVSSALVVLGLGVALTVGAVRGGGLLFDEGETAVSPSLGASAQTKPRATPFSLKTAHVLYQVLDEQGQYQLYAMPAAGGEGRPLTQAPYGIWDYALSPAGDTIVYSALRADRGSDLWAMAPDGSGARRLLACPDAACRNPSWGPEGERLVYEKLDMGDPAAAGTTTLWWLDLAEGETAPMFQDTQLPGFSPAWGPEGQWLSYIAPGMPTRIQLYNLSDGRQYDFVTKTSMAVIWHPEGEAILLTDVAAAQPTPGQPTRTHLLRFDVATAQMTDLSGAGEVSDSWPAWAPDGEQIAFVRRDFNQGADTRGNQIWIMSADGTEARPLTDAADTLFQHLAWSPDGRYLLFHQYFLNEPLAKPAVKLIAVESGEIRPLAQPGSQPAWMETRNNPDLRGFSRGSTSGSSRTETSQVSDID